MPNQHGNSTAFISYSWDDESHKEWVRDLAARLRQDGVEAILDQWEIHPGDQTTAFMEAAVRENDFVIIICTPTPRYKERSDNRSGGVGYEGDIMTAEVLNTGNRRTFIPVFAKRHARNRHTFMAIGKRTSRFEWKSLL